MIHVQCKTRAGGRERPGRLSRRRALSVLPAAAWVGTTAAKCGCSGLDLRNRKRESCGAKGCAGPAQRHDCGPDNEQPPEVESPRQSAVPQQPQRAAVWQQFCPDDLASGLAAAHKPHAHNEPPATPGAAAIASTSETNRRSPIVTEHLV
jgi:hypothetical protein